MEVKVGKGKGPAAKKAKLEGKSEAPPPPPPPQREEKKFAKLVRIGHQGEVRLPLSKDDDYTISGAFWPFPRNSQPTNVILCDSYNVGNPQCRLYFKGAPNSPATQDNTHTVATLTDDASSNGTFVNMAKLTTEDSERILNFGDIISFGYRFRESESEQWSRNPNIFAFRYMRDDGHEDAILDAANTKMNVDVIEAICSYLPVADINNCRLINPVWKDGAMSALKKKTVVKLPCSLSKAGLGKLKSLFRKVQRDISHSKIHVAIQNPTNNASVPVELLQQFAAFFRSFPWIINELIVTTRLSSSYEWEFFTSLLGIFSQTIEDLTLNLKVDGNLHWNQNVRHNFPNLKSFRAEMILKRGSSLYFPAQETSFEDFGRWLTTSMPNLKKLELPCDTNLPFYRGAVQSQSNNLTAITIGPRVSTELDGSRWNANSWIHSHFKLSFLIGLHLPLSHITKMSLYLPHVRSIFDVLTKVSSTLEELHVVAAAYRYSPFNRVARRASRHGDSLSLPSLPQLRELRWKTIFPSPVIMGARYEEGLNYAEMFPNIETVIIEAEFKSGFLTNTTAHQWGQFLNAAFPQGLEACRSLKMLQIPKPDLFKQLQLLLHRRYRRCADISRIYQRIHHLFPNAIIVFNDAKIFPGVKHHYTFP